MWPLPEVRLYDHWYRCVTFKIIIRICVGDKTVVSVGYEFKRI